MRSFSDLDLLVHPQDLLRTKAILERNEYSLFSTLHWPCDSAVLRAPGGQVSFKSSLGIFLDLHWRLLPDFWPLAFESDEIWPRRVAGLVAGRTAWTLSREHTLLFLCIHGAQHSWTRLGWICDVARLLQIDADLDWDYVFAWADQTRTSKMLALGLALAVDLVGAEAPLPAKERIALCPESKELAEKVWNRYLRCAPIAIPPLEAVQFSSRMYDRTGERLRQLFEILIRPSEAEYRVLQLPPALFGLYYGFRPLRLFLKYLANNVVSFRQKIFARRPIR